METKIYNYLARKASQDVPSEAGSYLLLSNGSCFAAYLGSDGAWSLALPMEQTLGVFPMSHEELVREGSDNKYLFLPC